MFVPQTFFLVQILLGFGGKKDFSGKIKEKRGQFGDKKEYRYTQSQFSQVSGLISVGWENDMFGVICDNVPKKTHSKQKEQNQPPQTVELSDYQKFMIKFTCANPRIVHM